MSRLGPSETASTHAMADLSERTRACRLTSGAGRFLPNRANPQKQRMNSRLCVKPGSRSANQGALRTVPPRREETPEPQFPVVFLQIGDGNAR